MVTGFPDIAYRTMHLGAASGHHRKFGEIRSETEEYFAFVTARTPDTHTHTHTRTRARARACVCVCVCVCVRGIEFVVL